MASTSRPDLTVSIAFVHSMAVSNAVRSHAEPEAVAAIIAALNIHRYGRHAARNQSCNKVAPTRLVRLARQLAAANASE